MIPPTKFSIRLSKADLRRFRACCKLGQVSMSAVIRYAVTHGLLENIGGAQCQITDDEKASAYANRNIPNKIWDSEGVPETWDPNSPATGGPNSNY